MASRTVNRKPRPVKSKTTANAPRRLTPAIITDIDATAANTIRLTFNARVVKGDLPSFTAGAAGAMTVTAMNGISETVIELVFSGNVAGTNLIVPEGDPGIRTWPAGFVPAGVYAIPAFP